MTLFSEIRRTYNLVLENANFPIKELLIMIKELPITIKELLIIMYYRQARLPLLFL